MQNASREYHISLSKYRDEKSGSVSLHKSAAASEQMQRVWCNRAVMYVFDEFAWTLLLDLAIPSLHDMLEFFLRSKNVEIILPLDVRRSRCITM